MKKRNAENLLLTGIFLLVLAGFTGLFFDYYYDLNDDVLMKDILAGVYTGEPESRNIQMLYGISAFVSLLYRLAPGLPWYGIFLCICQYGSIGVILYRGLFCCSTRKGKAGMLLAGGILAVSMLLYHMVYVQYTVTCTMVGAAGAWYFYTADSRLSPGKYIVKNIPSILLVMLAYLIRSEMLLLVLPMICCAGLCKWGSEEKIFTRDNGIRYLGVAGLMVLGLMLSQAAHWVAHSSPEWRTFTEYFNNRTELYDFQEIPEYEGNEEFFDSMGISVWERELLDNYNFGLSDQINGDVLIKTAQYYRENYRGEKSFLQNLKESLGRYRYRLFHVVTRNGEGKLPVKTGGDYPFNILVLTLYLGVGILLLRRRFWEIWKIALLFLIRTGLWMFILIRGRDPERITNSLYLMEFCILLGLFAGELLRREDQKRKRWALILLTILAAEALVSVPGVFARVELEQERREGVNETYYEMLQYFKEEDHKDNFYFIDVYSTVAFSEKMFKNVDNSLANHDIMGGWANKSPLYVKKLRAFGFTSMEDAILRNDRVFLAAEEENDLVWLRGYYQDQGIEIKIDQTERIGEDMNIYRITEKDRQGDGE